jgi:hypothetical protein
VTLFAFALSNIPENDSASTFSLENTDGFDESSMLEALVEVEYGGAGASLPGSSRRGILCFSSVIVIGQLVQSPTHKPTGKALTYTHFLKPQYILLVI